LGNSDFEMSNKQTIPWTRISVEAAAIVASILLAFSIDAWWDSVQNRAEEREILSLLRAEFEANQKILARTAGIHRLNLGAMQEIISASEKDIPVHGEYLDSLFLQAAGTPHYNPATGALAATISSGRIDLVRNIELRNRLAGWNAIVSDLMLDEQTRRDFVIHEVRPTFAEFGIAGVYSATNGAEADFSEALRSRKLLAHLRTEIANVAHLLTHFDDAEAATQVMISDLAEELQAL
jgi:hypothetical protein